MSNENPIIDFQAACIAANENKFDPSELSDCLRAFIEEFNNWLTANFVESYVEQFLIVDVNAFNLDNSMFEGYSDRIRIHAELSIKPMRWFVVSQYNTCKYRLAVARHDYSWLNEPF